MTNSHPQIITGGNFALRLGVFYVALFAGMGVHLPFVPLWFEAKGLDPGTVGLALAAPMLIRVFVVPLVARQADRADAVRGWIVAASLATVFGYAFLGFAEAPLAIVLVYALAATMFTPVMPLSDAFALRGLAHHGRSYGSVRLWGSAAFIVGGFIAGLLVDAIAARDLIWLIVAGFGASAIAACMLALPGAGTIVHSAPPQAAGGLLRNPAFICVLAASACIQASHALFYGFSTIDWRAAGFDGKEIAALWAIGVIAEIVLFAFSGRLPAAMTPNVLLLIGAGGAALRWLAMALAPPTWSLPILQCLHGISFGATHLGALAYLARASAFGLGATAQGYHSVVIGLAMAAAMSLSGVLYAAFGGAAYAAMTLAALAGGGFALAAQRVDARASAP